MASKKHKHRTLSSRIWETIREEWGIWLVIAILLLVTFLFSDKLAAWLETSAFIKVLDSLSKLGLLVAAIAFLREIPKWEERAEEEGSLSIGKQLMPREPRKEAKTADYTALR